MRLDKRGGVADHLVERPAVAGQDRQAGGHRLDHREAELLAPGRARGARQHEHVALGEQRRHAVVRHRAGELQAGAHAQLVRHRAEPPLQGTGADQGQLRVDAAVGQKPQRDGEILDALLRDEPGDADHAQRPVAPLSCGGREALQVDPHREHLDPVARHTGELEVQAGVLGDRQEAIGSVGDRPHSPARRAVGGGRERDVLPHRRHHAPGVAALARPHRLQRVGVGQLGHMRHVEPAQRPLQAGEVLDAAREAQHATLREAREPPQRVGGGEQPPDRYPPPVIGCIARRAAKAVTS